jgi:putative addiction module component (TIGR02574 family)
MSDVVVALAEQGKALPPDDRTRLVDMLLVSMHEETLSQIEASWDKEVDRRLAAFSRGESAAIDGETVLTEAHALVR